MSVITVPIMGSVLFPDNDTIHQLFTRFERQLLCLINTAVANQKPPTVFHLLLDNHYFKLVDQDQTAKLLGHDSIGLLNSQRFSYLSKVRVM